jgi:hypothetical protein
MRYKHIFNGHNISIIILIVALLIALLPIVYYYFSALSIEYEKQNLLLYQYQLARVLAASLSVVATILGFGLALLQYHSNSLNKKKERSMAFWQRSNSAEVAKDMRCFIKYWIDNDEKCNNDEAKLERAFIKLIGTSKKADLKIEESIENLLDFYDEACSATKMGACDEDTMFFYLGPLMIYHWQRLKVFIIVWTKNQRRPEKWNCFVNVCQCWKPYLDNKRLPSGKPLPYPVR